MVAWVVWEEWAVWECKNPNPIKNLKRAKPNMTFSSDFIVGYPGETEKDFDDTISLIKEVNFINSFSFIWERRKCWCTQKRSQSSACL